MYHFHKRWLFTFLICSTFHVQFFADSASATLGEPASSIVSNRTVLKAVKKKITTLSAYIVHEDASDGGRIRQYVSSDGIVFAVAWDGISHPDLAILLGNYYDDYSQVLRNKTRKPGKRSVQFSGNRVIVEKWGHMRNLQGRAYAPTLLPNGVNTDEIR